MADALEWPALFSKIRPHLTLAKNGVVDSDGWATARCIFTEHAHDDVSPSLRLNTRSGGARCFKCSFSVSLNDVAKALDISIFADDGAQAPKPPPGRTAPKNRTPTLEELAEQRMLPVEVFHFSKWAPTSGGWIIPIDDPDVGAFTRKKSLPGEHPKYIWSARGVKAADLVYGLSRVDPSRQELLIAAGEPDKIVLTHADYPTISFLAGENAAPSERAIEKVLAALPNLKTVSIVYDRDASGRAGAQKVADAFNKAGKAVEICTLPDSLPEKGDITDLWKACDGDRERFAEALDAVLLDAEHREPLEPKVTELDFDQYQVDLPSMGGWIYFGFSGMERRGRDLTAEVTTKIVGIPGFPKTAMAPTNLNLSSSTGRKSLKDELEATFGTSLDWHQQLNAAAVLVRDAYLASSPGRDLFDVVSTPINYRIGGEDYGFAPDGEMTILFGDGGVSKTNIGLHALICVAYGLPFLGMPTIQAPVLMVDAEANEGRIRDRAERHLQGMGLSWNPRMIHYWPARGRSLIDMQESLRQYVRRHGVEFYLKDSITLLCSGEPEKADQARLYSQATQYIGIGGIDIAHVTQEAGKSSSQLKPFGSVFWHNTARATWNVQKNQAEGSRAMAVGLYNRKMNDDETMRPIGLSVRFDGRTGPIQIEQMGSIHEDKSLSEKTPLRDRIYHAISKQYKSEAQLAEELFPDAIDEEDKKKAAGQIRARLSELHRSGAARKDDLDGRWSLITGRKESA
jgi:hypothetical protein